MPQAIIVRCDGVLRLWKPPKLLEPIAEPVDAIDATDLEWAGTDLDDIQVEDLAVESDLTNQNNQSKEPQSSKERGILDSWIRFDDQHRLYGKDGVLRCRRRRLNEHLSSLGDARIPSSSSSTSNDSADSTRPQSPFLRLPVELRLQVYQHLLVTPRATLPRIYSLQSHLAHGPKQQRHYLSVLPQQSHTAGQTPRQRSGKVAHPAILATCQQIYHEAAPILYGSNEFQRVHAWPSPWLQQLYITGLRRELRRVPAERRLRLHETDWVTRVVLVHSVRSAETPGRLGGLRVEGALREFVGLRELRLEVRLTRTVPGPAEALRRALREAGGEEWRGRLRRVSCVVAVPFGRLYWDFGGPALPWIHERFSMQDFRSLVEGWMAEDGAFVGRRVKWTLTTTVSKYWGWTGQAVIDIDNTASALAEPEVVYNVVGEGSEVLEW